MKVFRGENGAWRLIGRAEVPDQGLPVFRVPLFGAGSRIAEAFIIGMVTQRLPGRDAPVAERAILLSAGQHPEVLPGWRPLGS